jgi:hypothetical protein
MQAKEPNLTETGLPVALNNIHSLTQGLHPGATNMSPLTGLEDLHTRMVDMTDGHNNSADCLLTPKC